MSSTDVTTVAAYAAPAASAPLERTTVPRRPVGAHDILIDINGYFVPADNTTALTFYPITPCRILDTRNPQGPFGGPVLAAGATRSLSIPASIC